MSVSIGYNTPAPVDDRVIGFIVSTVGTSLSGAMSPGPMTPATLAAGQRDRHAGAWVCVGHVLVELPLILLLAAGLGTFLKSPTVRAWIGLIGGAMLLWMGVQILTSLRRVEIGPAPPVERHPLWIGLWLSAANPCFLFWWATVGLTLTGRAMEFGHSGLLLFASLHWLCDLGWLEVLSLAGFKGSSFGRRSQKVISLLCAAMLLAFGVKFVWDAVRAFP
jgi:threonine/homoserine/homoserine lactone efflux protein